MIDRPIYMRLRPEVIPETGEVIQHLEKMPMTDKTISREEARADINWTDRIETYQFEESEHGSAVIATGIAWELVDEVDRLEAIIADRNRDILNLRSNLADKDAEIERLKGLQECWEQESELTDRVCDARDRLAAENERLREALRDALSGWRYIRQVHGDLSGVGWDRVEDAARAALADSGDER